MRPSKQGRALMETGLVAASGLLLYLAVLALEGLAGLLLPAASPEAARRALFALVEESAKLLLVLAFGLAFAPRRAPARGGAARGLSFGIASVAVFAALENLGYFAAFPGWGAASRLLWSEPVHIVSALALALGTLPLVMGRRARTARATGCGPEGRGTERRGRGSRARAALALSGGLAFALAWHLAANLAASGILLPRAAASPGAAARLLASGSILNAAALWALGRLYLEKAVIGGFLYGKE